MGLLQYNFPKPRKMVCLFLRIIGAFTVFDRLCEMLLYFISLFIYYKNFYKLIDFI